MIFFFMVVMAIAAGITAATGHYPETVVFIVVFALLWGVDLYLGRRK